MIKSEGDKMKYQPLESKSALNKVSGRFPFKWDLNIYRGCQHGCIYVMLFTVINTLTTMIILARSIIKRIFYLV